MARIGCNVLNCSHNDAGVCYANRISITGKKAHTSNHTCCSSFLDQSTYSNLTSNTCTNVTFKNRIGKNVTLSIDDPRDDLTEEQIKATMELIIEKNIFKKNNHTLVEAVDAQIINSQTDDYDLIL